MVQPPTEFRSQTLPALRTKLAIVGSSLGRVRYGAALAGATGINVVGIVDADLRAGRGWAREFPSKPAVYASVDKLLEARPELDGVIVAGATEDRPAAIELLASVGIPVLTEFPFTKTLAELDRLAAIADSSRSSIIPAFTHRHENAVQEVKRIVDGGGVGAIGRLRCEVSFPLSATYALENGLIPVSIDWYDLLQVVACRTLDLCIGWLGNPESINADIDLPHHAALVGRRAADPVANLIVNHVAGQSTHLLKLSRSVQPTERYLLSGERGTVELVRCEGEKLASGPTVRVQNSNSKPETVYASDDFEADLTMASTILVDEFTESIRSGSSSGVSLTDARTVLETVQAAFASARDGIRTPLPLLKPVDVDGILEGK